MRDFLDARQAFVCLVNQESNEARHSFVARRIRMAKYLCDETFLAFHNDMSGRFLRWIDPI